MKDLKPEDKALFRITPDVNEALERIRTALNFLWKDNIHRGNDKVAGVYDYEELIGALLSAEAALVSCAEEDD